MSFYQSVEAAQVQSVQWWSSLLDESSSMFRVFGLQSGQMRHIPGEQVCGGRRVGSTRGCTEGLGRQVHAWEGVVWKMGRL